MLSTTTVRAVLVTLAVFTAGVVVLEVQDLYVTGTVEPKGCLARKCCDGMWTLKCPNAIVAAGDGVSGPADNVHGVSCPEPDMKCWVITKPHAQIPNVAAVPSNDWSPPRVVDEHDEPIPVAPGPCEGTPPQRFSGTVSCFCPVGGKCGGVDEDIEY